MKNVFIDTVKDGDVFDSIFLIDDISERATKKNKSYWILTLKDKTGSLQGKVWDNECWCGTAVPGRGEYVKVRVEVSSYKGKLDLNVKKIRRIEETEPGFDYADFVPVGPHNRFSMIAELELWATHSIKHPGLRAVVESLFTDPKYFAAIRDCPAASNMHQAYIGGLAEHIRNMLKISKHLGDQYELPQDSVDLLYAACFLHDIGKIEELKWTKAIGYTTEGQLIGHIGLGFEILERLRRVYWDGLGINPEGPSEPLDPDEGKEYDWGNMIWAHLRHLLASHHGQLEWRAVALPQSREAHLFHLIDMIDSRMGVFDRLDKNDVDEDGFTQFENRLGTRAWRPNHEDRN